MDGFNFKESFDKKLNKSIFSISYSINLYISKIATIKDQIGRSLLL